MFPRKFPVAIVLFWVGFLFTIGVNSCSMPTSVKSASVDTSAAAIHLPATNPGKTLSDIMARGEVKIAVPDDFPPFGSVGADMNVHGYDIDVAHQVAQAMGVKVETVPVIGNYRIPFLQTNRVDMVISSLGKNKDRERIIDFSIPYAPFYSGVYGSETLGIQSYANLQGKTVGVTQGSLEDLELAKNLSEGNVQNVTVKRFANNSLTASALISGQVELIATGNVVANKLIHDNPTQRIAKQFVMKNSPCYVGFRKGDANLQAKVNEILMTLRHDRELDKLAQQWFGEPLGDLPTT